MMTVVKSPASPVGPGVLQAKREQMWDIYCRKAFCPASAADLATRPLSFFDIRDGQQYAPVGATAGTTPNFSVTKSDTNLETPGQVPFDYIVDGIAVQIINTQLTPGTVGGVNDMAFWAQYAMALLSEFYIEVKLNQTTLDEFLAIDAPGAGGFSGFAAQGTSAALTTGASVSSINNGVPVVSNYRSYSAFGPLTMKAGARLSITGTFGAGMLNQSGTNVYKPSISATQVTFIRIILKGRRKDWAQ